MFEICTKIRGVPASQMKASSLSWPSSCGCLASSAGWWNVNNRGSKAGEMVLNWMVLILLSFVNGELNPHGCEGLIATVRVPDSLCHHCINKIRFQGANEKSFFFSSSSTHWWSWRWVTVRCLCFPLFLLQTRGWSRAALCVCSGQWLTYPGWQAVCWAVGFFWIVK